MIHHGALKPDIFLNSALCSCGYQSQGLAGHPVSKACRDLKTKADVLAACRRSASHTPVYIKHIQGCCVATEQLLALLCSCLLNPRAPAHICCRSVVPDYILAASAVSVALQRQRTHAKKTLLLCIATPQFCHHSSCLFSLAALWS